MTESLNHLAPWARKIVSLSNEERIHQIKSDRWIGYTRAEKALSKLEGLMNHPKRHRMPNFLITGPTNNGKTMIVEKFRRLHNEKNGEHFLTESDALLMNEPRDFFRLPKNFISGYVFAKRDNKLELFYYRKSIMASTPIKLESEQADMDQFLQEIFERSTEKQKMIRLSVDDVEKITFFTEHRPAKEVPILIMQMPSDPKISRFYAMLLYKLEVNINARRPRLLDLEGIVLNHIKELKVKVLIIDEMHNVFSSSDGAQREFFNLIRFMGNELKIPIVCVGTKEAAYAISRDEQLVNRFEHFSLPLWNENTELSSLLASILAALPLKKPSLLTTPEFIRFILNKSEGYIGEIITLLTNAAILAIETGEETINKKILAKVEYVTPTEKQRFSERNITK